MQLSRLRSLPRVPPGERTVSTHASAGDLFHFVGINTSCTAASFVRIPKFATRLAEIALELTGFTSSISRDDGSARRLIGRLRPLNLARRPPAPWSPGWACLAQNTAGGPRVLILPCGATRLL
jgi:hypothetical protein